MKEIKYGQIGERLREERLRLGIAQVDFAEASSASRNALLQWEKGETTPNAAALGLMAGLGVDVLYVVTGQRAGESESTLVSAERELLQAWRQGTEQGRKAMQAVAELATKDSSNIKSR